MQEKKVEVPLLISNFEINKKSKTVILYINSRIFPVSIIRKTASLFNEKAWVAIDDNQDEILIELKPKIDNDLELLAREFNNELLNQTTKEINVDAKSEALLSKIKEVVAEFVREEQGKISKQSIITIGAILATLGLAGSVEASHNCPQPEPPYWAQPGDGGGCDGGGGDGGCGCFAEDEMVLTPKGMKKIADISVGEEVTSYDEINDRFVTSIVGNIMIHDGKINSMANFNRHPLVKIWVKTNNLAFTTKVTDNHPYFDAIKKKYMPLREFKIGDIVKTMHGKGIIMKKINVIDSSKPPNSHDKTVYNLHIARGPHNYIVNNAIVHNK